MGKLAEAVETARHGWHLKHGKCSICELGDKPENDGYHYISGRHACGNAESCLLCRNVLPPGEHCRACGRINVWETEC